MAQPQPIQTKALSRLDGIAHGFFTREGGSSTGLYESLNAGLGSGDDRAVVEANRSAITATLGTARLASAYQIHSATVVRAEEIDAELPQADGIVCAEPGLAIGVVTADCGPVLFADSQAKIIGACHAGWKGALGGVLENTLAAMETAGAERSRITAVLGPTIQVSAYEVGLDFPLPFLERDESAARFFSSAKREGHAMFDLPAYIVWRLEEAGIAAAHSTGHCTYEDEKRFFSYRRTTHRNEADYGRQISAITLLRT